MPSKGARRRAAKRIPLTDQRQQQVAIKEVAPAEPEKPVGDRWQYWLIQRLIPVVDTARPGVSRYFRFDDMEYVEFAPHNILDCLKEIRSSGNLIIASTEMAYGGKSRMIYFVGSSESMDTRISDMRAWLDEPLTKGYTEFGFHFAGDYTGRLAKYRNTRAWLSLKNHVFFTLEKQYAEQILEGLNNPPQPKAT